MILPLRRAHFWLVALLALGTTAGFVGYEATASTAGRPALSQLSSVTASDHASAATGQSRAAVTAAPTPSYVAADFQKFTASVVVPSVVKPVIRGLIDRQGAPAVADLAAVHAYVVKVNWADLQPVAGGPIIANNVIDQAIARVRQPDFLAAGVVLKLRVFAGIGAPNWAKALGGAPIPFVNNQSGGSISGGTIGRFWTAPFEAAYADLQSKLAANYDTVPEVRELTMDGCSTIFDEPFVRQFGAPANVAGLKGAGYTAAADRDCILSMVKAHDVWKHTTSDIDLNPFPNIDSPAKNRDLAFTESVMQTCRTELGSRCGLQNNALSTSKLANNTFKKLYEAMSTLGSPLIFQTAASSRLGDPQQVLQNAITLHANSVELPQGYQTWPLRDLAGAALRLSSD